MKNLTRLLSLFTLSFAFSSNAFSENIDPCPSQLVNFWNEFATTTRNLSAIPEFLLKNQCVNARVSTLFYTTTAERFDHPEKVVLVDELYAQLSWVDTKSFTK